MWDVCCVCVMCDVRVAVCVVCACACVGVRVGVGEESPFLDGLGSAPQELNTTRPEAKLEC
jgi:hypothetical protein